jgi:hypothetical protein
MNARSPFATAALQLVRDDQTPSPNVKLKCRVCRSMLRSEEGDDLVIQVCAFCESTPDGKRLRAPSATAKGPTTSPAAQATREFTPAEKSMIQKMHRFTSASELLGILNERLSFDLGSAAVPYRLEQVNREINELAVPAPVSGRDWVGMRKLINQARRDGVLPLINEQVINDFAVVFSLNTRQVLALKDVLLQQNEEEES